MSPISKKTIIPSIGHRNAPGARLQTLVVTIAFHPDRSRIGAYAEIEMSESTSADSNSLHVEIGRYTPVFSDGGGLGEQTASYGISRSGNVIVDVIDGELSLQPLFPNPFLKVAGSVDPGERRSQAALRAGLIVQLSAGVVLILRSVETQPAHNVQSDSFVMRYPGCSPEVRSMYRLAEAASRHHYPVLIMGEAGVGKEALARAIHFESRSGRRTPFSYDTISAYMTGKSMPDPDAVPEKPPVTSADSGHATILKYLHRATPSELDRLADHMEWLASDLGVADACSRERLIATAVDARKALGKTDAVRPLFAQFIHIPPLRFRPEDVALALCEGLREEEGSHEMVFERETFEICDEQWRVDCYWAEVFFCVLSSPALNQWPDNHRSIARFCSGYISLDAMREAAAVTIGSARAGVRSVARPAIHTLTDAEFCELAAAFDYNYRRLARELSTAPANVYRRVQDIPTLRTARDLTLEEIESALARLNGDVARSARALKVSQRSLRMRQTELRKAYVA